MSIYISLLNVAKYYEGLPHQDEALKQLQAELEKTHPDLFRSDAEFLEIWRNPEYGQVSTTISTSSVTITASRESSVGNGDRTTTAVLTTERTATVEQTTTVTTAPPKPTPINLNIPYLSQLDNVWNPHGSCNVTSVAMCLTYLGHPIKNTKGQQLEDELYQFCLNNGLSRHSPTDLAILVQKYGCKDDFQPDAKWSDVKKWLEAGKPIIVHGWFSRSGHIIVIKGYNEKGWIVNDPYGEWFSWGYDTTVSGKGLTYSYGMMKQLCGSDGDLWIHYISR
jgi:uncharacterized protein YvpB